MQNDKELDILTGKLLKSTGFSEPSSDFTKNVMRAVMSSPLPVKKTEEKRWHWLLAIFAISLSGIAYLYAFPQILKHLIKYVNPFFIDLYSVSGMFTQFIHSMLNFSFSPFILLVSSTIFLLLLTDSLFTRKRIQN